jgi:hypothetical protein
MVDYPLDMTLNEDFNEGSYGHRNMMCYISVGISFFFVNGTFYVFQCFHTPGHDGQSSSHRNELHGTTRDSNVHSNHPSEDNM